MISVAIIEDDQTISEAIQDYLNAQPDFSCELAEASVEAFVARLDAASRPQVVLMDIGLPGMSGIAGIKLIKERDPEIDIVMLTVHNDPEAIFQSLCVGASGYLLKNTPFAQIKEGLEMLHRGGAPMSPEIARRVIEYFQPPQIKPPPSPLTEREKEIVTGLVDGLSYKMIAERLHISIETVRVHIKNIYRKLHIHGKAEVIGKSLRGEI